MSEPFVPSTHKETTSKPPSQDISTDNVLPEEVYQREKGTEEFMMENPDVSHISDDYYWNEETKPSVFKNALANLSEGLASMHRQDILNNTDSNRKNPTKQPKNFNIKSGSNSRRRLHSGRSKQSQKENLETLGDNLATLMQQTEPNVLENKGMSNRPSAFLQEIDLKATPQYQTLEDDNNNDQKTVEDYPHNLNTSLHEDDKLVTEHSDDMPVKDYPQSENILKSAKVTPFENEVASANQLEGDYDSEKLSSGNITRKYNVVIKKSKIPVGQRSVRQLQQDDLRINKTLLQTKQVSSPEAISIEAKQIKRDSIPPVIPVAQNPKNVAFIKELQNRNPQLKIDGIGQKLRQKENELSENFNFKKRVLGEPLEVRSNNTSLRTVLGQAFKDAEAPPLFSLNLKGTSIGKQKESKENIKESVDYILGLYKTGAEKNPEKMRLFEMNPSRESIKATESLKRTSYLAKAQPLKEKVINQEEIVNRTSLKQYVTTGIGFKVKKSTGNEFDDKKMALPGTVRLNENVFQ